MNFLEKAQSLLSDPKKLVKYGQYCNSRLAHGNGVVKLSQNVRLSTSSFSEYLSVFGLKPDDNELKMFEKYVTDAKEVFDLGANVGAWTVFMSKANPRARIHSFEPNPVTFALLEKNARQNNCTKAVLNRAAVSNAAGNLKFQIPKNASIFCRVEPEVAAHDEQNRYADVISVVVPAVKLSDYCKTYSIAEIDFMKVDVEGHELAALRGLEAFLSERRVKAMYIETSKLNHDAMGHRFSDLLEFIRECGYNFHKLAPDGGPGSLVAISEIEAPNHLCLPA